MDSRIKKVSGLLIFLGALLALYMTFGLVTFLATHVWSDPAALARLFRFADPETQIPFWIRVCYTIVQALPVVMGLAALYHGAKLMNGFRIGRYFAPITTRSMSLCGLALIGVATFAIVARITSGPLISQFDAPGRGFVSLRLDTYDLGFLLAGLAMWVTGWVLTSAFALQAENESFV